MNMKKTIYFLLGLFAVTICFQSCTDQDETYKQYIKKGGYLYPQVASNLAEKEGYKRIQLSWDTPKDPSIRTAKIYWGNRADSFSIDYSKYTGDQITFDLKGLDERSYTFEVINYDKDGNASMTKEITSAPYAESWLALHAARNITSEEQIDGTTFIKMTSSTDEMVSTEVRYVNNSGDSVSVYVVNDSNSLTIPDAKVGTRFSYRSSYCPFDGLDTVWTAWQKSPTPIVGRIDCSSWTPVATDHQVWSSDYLEKFIFDGVNSHDAGHRWCSSGDANYQKVFPKIMSIDMGKDSYQIAKIVMQQSPNGVKYHYAYHVEIYFGNQPFDQNAGSGYADTDAFKNAGLKISSKFYLSTYAWNYEWKEAINYRYMAIVWKDSRSSEGYIDLTELEVYGYDSAAG